MEINIDIRATSADDYRNAIKALMDGAGLVGFDIPAEIPVNITPVVQEPVKAAKAKQKPPVEAPVPSTEELPVETDKPSQTPTAADSNRAAGDWTPGGGKQPEDVPTVTLEDVQTTARKLALAGRMDTVKAVLKKYGAPKITELPAETWAAAKAEMEASDNGTE